MGSARPREGQLTDDAPPAEAISLPRGRMTRARIRRGLRETFISLRYPNYRLWFAGQLVSLFGTWMQVTAQGFLIYELTRSPAYLGYVGFASGAPSWLFTLYGGVVADRIPRRTLLIITQSTMMLLAFTLAVLTFSGRVQPWHIIVLAFLLGVANAFDAPARQSFTIELVEREDLTNAIALNATMFNAATIVGPAVGGIVYALAGAAWCFVVNGVSFVAVIAALAMMKLGPGRLPANGAASGGLRQGLRYVASAKTVRGLMACLGAFAFFGIGIVTLIPAWSVEVLDGNAATNGLLLSARGIGSLIAGLMIAALGRYQIKGKLLTLGSFAMGLMLLAFAATNLLPFSMLAIAGVGWGFMLIVNTINALVQSRVPDELRGRVMGIYTLVFFGMIPIGSLLAGIAAAELGVPATAAIWAVLQLVVASLLWFRWPGLRRLP
jgi:predicted MFS family arabinose efflux permease